MDGFTGSEDNWLFGEPAIRDLLWQRPSGLGEKASYIIDSAPFKQGRFAPASHLKIVPPAYLKKNRQMRS